MLNSKLVALSRRRWMSLVASGLTLASGTSRAGGDDQTRAPESSDHDEERLIETIRGHVKVAGLSELRLKEGTWHLFFGTAAEDYFDQAAMLCEGIAIEYQKHFRRLDYPVERPVTRMPVIAVADSTEFQRLLGTTTPSVGGLYDLDLNWLVVFDFRENGQRDFVKERSNSIALFHEATHQLTFNTGLLNRAAEVPLLISEGLATYGEVRRPRGRASIGDLNRERLGVLWNALIEDKPFHSVSDLLSNDELFVQEETIQLAYAEAWLFTYALLQTKSGRRRLLSYIKTLRESVPGAQQPADRIGPAREHLGNLERIDRDLKDYATQLIRGGR